ncbi:MAG: alpha/beta hydrolase [Chlorobium sp.]|jgi:pimeloyl-ACP methyl ester carboxylesterase|nr:alpha/beta hydrolase [Chlorobium sp.]
MKQIPRSISPEIAACQLQIMDITMNCRVLGSGHPLLMIMGYGSTMNLWESTLLEKLAEHFNVIVFDNRGIGGTQTGTQPFSIGQFAEDSAALLQSLDVEHAHVLGWSMGSLIAQELALRHPSLISKLILYAAHCDAKMFPPSPEVLTMLTDTSGTPEERGMRYISVLFPDDWLHGNGQRMKEIFFRPMGTIPEESVSRQAAAIDEWNGTTGKLGEITCPTLLITGSEDKLTVPDNARYMSERIPDAELVIIENGGHGLMFQYPEIFRDSVIGFLG